MKKEFSKLNQLCFLIVCFLLTSTALAIDLISIITNRSSKSIREMQLIPAGVFIMGDMKAGKNSDAPPIK